jgi:hypothetical protein
VSKTKCSWARECLQISSKPLSHPTRFTTGIWPYDYSVPSGVDFCAVAEESNQHSCLHKGISGGINFYNCWSSCDNGSVEKVQDTM